MTKDENSREGVYRFDLVVGASVAIVATQGRSARDAVVGALEGAAAKLTSGSGIGLELEELRVVDGSVVLRTIDGVDPTSALSRLLADWRARRARD